MERAVWPGAVRDGARSGVEGGPGRGRSGEGAVRVEGGPGGGGPGGGGPGGRGSGGRGRSGWGRSGVGAVRGGGGPGGGQNFALCFSFPDLFVNFVFVENVFATHKFGVLWTSQLPPKSAGVSQNVQKFGMVWGRVVPG